QVESGARMPQRLRHRRRVHDVHGESESVDPLHGAHRARGESRRRGAQAAESMKMNRREALKTTATLLGGVYLTSSGVLSACASPPRKSTAALDADDQALIEEIA